MPNAILTLSDDNVIVDSDIALERYYAYFLASHYDQSEYYYGNITSFKELLKEYSDDMNILTSRMRESLITYLQRHFVTAVVDVSFKDNVLSVAITVVDDSGYKATLKDRSEVVDGTINVYQKLVEQLYRY